MKPILDATLVWYDIWMTYTYLKVPYMYQYQIHVINSLPFMEYLSFIGGLHLFLFLVSSAVKWCLPSLCVLFFLIWTCTPHMTIMVNDCATSWCTVWLKIKSLDPMVCKKSNYTQLTSFWPLIYIQWTMLSRHFMHDSLQKGMFPSIRISLTTLNIFAEAAVGVRP